MTTYLITFYCKSGTDALSDEDVWERSNWKISAESRSEALHKATLALNHFHQGGYSGGFEDGVGMTTVSKAGFNPDVDESVFFDLDDKDAQKKLNQLDSIWRQRFNTLENC